MKKRAPIPLRSACVQDLEAINIVIRNAISDWDLPERVKRLSLPSYTYDQHDLSVMGMVVAEDLEGEICGVAAWEASRAKDVPRGKSGFLLHGLYVEPKSQSRGVGAALLDAVISAAKAENLDGVLIKAQPAAVSFFQMHGGEKVSNREQGQAYAHLIWIAIP